MSANAGLLDGGGAAAACLAGVGHLLSPDLIIRFLKTDPTFLYQAWLAAHRPLIAPKSAAWEHSLSVHPARCRQAAPLAICALGTQLACSDSRP